MAGKGNKKEAKLASDAAARAAATRLLDRTCEHCGERIRSDQMQAVKRFKFDDAGHMTSRMVFYTKSHWSS